MFLCILGAALKVDYHKSEKTINKCTFFSQNKLKLTKLMSCSRARTTDTQWRHKSKISEKLGRCGRQNMLWPYLKIWDWDWIFGRAVKAIFSLGVRSPCSRALHFFVQPLGYITLDWTCSTGNSKRRAAGSRWRRANPTKTLRAPYTDKNSTKKERYFLEKSQENLSVLHPMQYWMFS
jgi:hypothetical protein